ncbi:hypothetical protein Tco_0957607, partial [Tanacetum coccineum]
MSGEEPATQIAPVESPQMVSTVKLPILKKGEYTLWSMRMEQYLTNTDYSLWQVILNGDGPIQVTTDEKAPLRVYTHTGRDDFSNEPQDGGDAFGEPQMVDAFEKEMERASNYFLSSSLPELVEAMVEEDAFLVDNVEGGLCVDYTDAGIGGRCYRGSNKNKGN